MAMINYICHNYTQMNMKNISILGTEYQVEMLDEIKNENGDKVVEGICDSSNRSIKVILKRPDGKPLAMADVKKNLWHEIVHAILDEGQYLELSENEPLVEWMARCITDVLEQTSPYWHTGFSFTLQDQQLEIPFNGQEGVVNAQSSNS